MSSPNAKSRTSPRITVHPPIQKAAEEKTQEGELILQRLQGGSTTSLTRVTPSESRRKSCVTFGENQEIKTIHERVKSTETLNKKGLIAADILQNCKKLQTQKPSKDGRRCQTADGYTRPAKMPPELGRTNRSKSAMTRKSSLITASLGFSDPVKREDHTRGIQLSNVFRSDARRGSLPAASLVNKSQMGNAILQKYGRNSQHRNSNGENHFLNSKPQGTSTTESSIFPNIKRSRSTGSNLDDSLGYSTDHKLRREKMEKSTLDMSNSYRRNSYVASSRSSISPRSSLTPKSPMSPRSPILPKSPRAKSPCAMSCGSDGIDEEPGESNSSASEDGSDKEKKTTPRKKPNSKAKSRKSSQEKTPSIDKGNSDSQSSDNDASSDEEDRGSPSARENVDARKQDVQMQNDDNNNNDNHENSDSDSDTDCVDDTLMMSSASETEMPGMPALDASRREKKPKPMANINKSDSLDHEDDLADDIDDLIDNLDDLIEADDEDIAYEASIESKQARKKKSFKNTTKLIIATRNLGRS